jgi:Ca-activated chloride channel family protein
MTLSFDYPWAWWGFAPVIPFIVYDLLILARQRAGIPPVLGRRLLASTIFFGFFLVFFVIALTGPRWGNAQVPAGFRRGVDVVIALDLSGSMDVRDIEDNTVSRLERGLSLAFETVAALPEPRYATATGRSRGLLTVPLTWDNDAVLNFLEAVDGGMLTGRGTNLESLLDAASGAFQDSSPSRRLILLVSDGESLSGSFKAAMDRLSQNNISVAALALGSDAGAPVPGSENTISRRDAQAMRMAAERTGGIYIDGNRSDAQALLVEYLRSSASRVQAGGGMEKKPRWFLFLIAAIISYGLSRLILVNRDERLSLIAGLSSAWWKK